MKFPFRPGRYGPSSVVVEPDGSRSIAAGHPDLMAWLEERDIDPSDVYLVSTISWSEGSPVWGALVFRFRSDRNGRKYVARWRRWLPDRFISPARRRPIWVSE